MIDTIMKSGEPDKEKKSCFDCFFCQGAVSWWCVSLEAGKYRGTAIPGVIKCQFWKPVIQWNELTFLQKFISKINPFQIYI